MNILPDDTPRKFPETTPLSDDGLEAAKKESASTMKAAPSDTEPPIEPVVPDDEPEEPAEESGD